MRQILFRLRLNELFSTEDIDGVAAIGVGWLLVPWLLYGLWWWYSHRKSEQFAEAIRTAAIMWIVVAVVILLVPSVMSGRALQSVPVFGYGFMLFVGFITAGTFAARRAKQVGIPENAIWDLAMWIFFGGIAGARLFYIIQYPDRVFANKQGLELITAIISLQNGGLVFYGGAILGIGSFLLFCWKRKISPLLMADVIIPSIFIGLMFGRMGCFLNGCCWGDRCELPWAVLFTQGSVPFNVLSNRGFIDPNQPFTLPLHPSQIYSALNAFVLCLLTSAYFPFRNKNGSVLAVGWILYPITRFMLEFVRGDEMGQFNTPLTISQWISIGLLTTGIMYLIWLTKIHHSEPLQKSPGGKPQLAGS